MDQTYESVRRKSKIALVLLLLYGSFAVFQLRSHTYLFDGSDPWQEPEDDHHYGREPRLNLIVLIVFGGIAIAMIVILGELFVGSLPLFVVNQPRPTPHWIGLILIPTISTLARQDLFEAAINARKGKFDVCVGMTTGASIHLVHFVLPTLVLLAWMLDKNLSLLLDPFQSITLFLCAVTVTLACIAGKSYYLLGVALLVLYATLAITYWFYPGNSAYPGLNVACT
ncbi:hypothetical protein B0H11DRAFT_2062879 [Mycena galericulata]|nr:hypothetical protein B0H11DRAFT_2062879 [Mycena galericulata]